MALSPIAFIAPNYRDFKNYWLKAYQPGTTTPKSMSLDDQGSVTVAKLEINKDGFIESAGGALVIPYIDGAYDAWLFPTEAEADSNTTTNAERVADDIRPSDITDHTDTVASMKGLNLISGTLIRTKGYYLAGDGGQADYLISAPQSTDGYGDHDLLNGNSALLQNNESVNIKQFGCVCDGVADDFPQLESAINVINETGKRFSAPALAIIKITGSTDITVYESVDFNNCSIDVSEWSGRFVITSRNAPIVYDNTTAVTLALINATKINGVKIREWIGFEEVEDSFIKIQSTTPFYSYRQIVRTQEEFNKCTSDGDMESSFLYGWTAAAGVGSPSEITSVTVLKIEDKMRSFGNMSLIVNNKDVGNNIILITGTSLWDIVDVRFVMGSEILANTNPVFISMGSCAHVKLKNIYLQRPNQTTSGTGFTYGIGLANSYDVECDNVTSIGDGWGATGNNSCQRVTFRNCRLSRIDFHQPFREYLNIFDCTVGLWGVLVTALGNLTIKRTTFLMTDENDFRQSTGPISSRPDTSGFCDGNLLVEDCEVDTRSFSGATMPMFEQFSTAGNDIPAGSPIRNTAWNRIDYKNITTPSGTILELAPKVVVGVSNTEYPYFINISDCVDGKFGAFFALDNKVPNSTYPIVDDGIVGNVANININIDKLRIDASTGSTMSILDNTADNFFVKADIVGLIGTGPSFLPTPELVCSGEVTIRDSEINSLDFFAGAANNRPLSVDIHSTKMLNFNDPASDILSNLSGSLKTDVIISNSTIYAKSDMESKELCAVRSIGNKIKWKGTAPTTAQDGSYSLIITIANFAATGGTNEFEAFLAVENPHRYNTYVINFGSGTSNSQIIFTMPTAGRTFYAAGKAGDYEIFRDAGDLTRIVVTTPGSNGPTNILMI